MIIIRLNGIRILLEYIEISTKKNLINIEICFNNISYLMKDSIVIKKKTILTKSLKPLSFGEELE